MTLQEKILQLKLDGAMAVRHALWWEKALREHGEEKTLAFYKSIGLNHVEDQSNPLTMGRNQPPPIRVIIHQDIKHDEGVTIASEKKGVEWEGLTLSREPTEAEKIAVKGVSQAQESAKESIGSVLLNLRTELIEDGLKGIKKLKPATYHELTLQASKESRAELRERLIKVHRQGRVLVARELGLVHPKGFVHEQGCNEKFIKNDPPGYQCECETRRGRFTSAALFGQAAGGAKVSGSAVAGNAFKQEEDEFDELDTLTDLTNSRVANDVQSRIIAAAARFALLGLTGAALLSAVQGEIQSGSVSYIDRASTGLANKVVNIGRRDEAENRRGDWGRVEYSALLDNNVCGPCASEDGKTADNEDDLQPAPNPECEGGDWCRCFHVYVNQ